MVEIYIIIVLQVYKWNIILLVTSWYGIWTGLEDCEGHAQGHRLLRKEAGLELRFPGSSSDPFSSSSANKGLHLSLTKYVLKVGGGGSPKCVLEKYRIYLQFLNRVQIFQNVSFAYLVNFSVLQDKDFLEKLVGLLDTKSSLQ